MEESLRQRILHLATRAPTSDNAQPFEYRWQDSRLLIYHDEQRALRRGNAGQTASLIGLGCLLESLVISASGEGRAAELALSDSLPSAAAPWAEVTFQPTGKAADNLLPGLARRASDRRPYRGGSLSDAVFAAIQRDARRFPACTLYLQDELGEPIVQYVLDCESFLWLDRQVLPDVLKWVRWNKREARETRDGIYWPGLAISYLTSRIMKLAAHSRLVRMLLRRSGGPLRSQRQVSRRQLETAAALGCFAVRDLAPATLVAVGRAFLRVWVRLNLAGYGLQVMANPSLHVYQHAAGLLPADYPAPSKRLFADGGAMLRSAFEIPAAETPAWMFRTGLSSDLPADWRTYRRPLAEVIRSGSAPS
ncbi:MAG: hypothetical protein R3300_19525 [Candidatus Promineifilaceae bacterium]|nr:hypothetical protein [Candidatus Promineifilaceae bacterium]